MTVRSRLLELLEQHKGETLSGENLAEQLGCTRAAVWKGIHALREEGYRIEAGPNRGYCLSPDTNRLSAEGVRLHLRYPDVEVQVMDETDSTNRVARNAAEQGAPHGSVYIARRQNKGRGRRGRSFYSPEGGLYLSIVLRPRTSLTDSLLLTTSAATAVFRAVRDVCGKELDIKWVNDLYYHDRKVTGILTEAVTDFESGAIESVVVGIGLNLYLDPANLPPELAGIAGPIFDDREAYERMDINRLAAQITSELVDEAQEPRLSREYVEHNMIPGKRIRIIDGERTRTADALRICPDGRLCVRESDGSETNLLFGEVSIMLEKP